MWFWGRVILKIGIGAVFDGNTPELVVWIGGLEWLGGSLSRGPSYSSLSLVKTSLLGVFDKKRAGATRLGPLDGQFLDVTSPQGENKKPLKPCGKFGGCHFDSSASHFVKRNREKILVPQ